MREEIQVVEITDVRQEPEGAAQLERIPASRLPATVFGLFQAGMERLNQGEAGAAAACFEQALSLAPEFADGHVGLGIAYALDSRIYPALDHLEETVELEPQNFSAHFKLGQLYFKLRVPQKGYEQMSLALNWADTLEERKRVAHWSCFFS
jgi:tetratricopeptide (TPR) repeat protein